jgi:hypothetical protein
MRRLRVLIASMAVSTALLVGSAGTAAAYGGGAGHDMWQVGISFNCNNPDFCGPSLGGFWAWAEFDRSADGTVTWGDVEGSGCFHTLGGGGAGALHISVEIESWTIESGMFFINGEETDSFRGTKTTFDVVHFATGVPATPGHYTAADVFGFDPPPGVAIQIQVAFRPAK